MTSPAGLVPLWSREPVAAARDANVLFVCFAKGPLSDDVKMQVDRFGVASVASLRAVEVREHAREAAPEWFDNWRSGALRLVAQHGLRGDLSALDDADRCFTLETTVRDAADLGHLQSVWALTRWFFERGASVALDVHAMRFFGKADGPEPSAAFDVKREVSLIFETDATVVVAGAPRGHVVHTRGLRKLGRPDIVAACLPYQVDFASEIIWQLADGMARGFMPALPRHGVDISKDESWYLVADEGDAFATRLGLDNDARLLVDANGAPLCAM